MNKTSIGWTDFTSNPIRYKDAAGEMVWGCERTSPGCAHCYAADLAVRYGRGGGAFTHEEMQGYTPYFDDKEAHKILNARVVGGMPVKGGRCFIGDMTDVFGSWVPDAFIVKLFAVFALRHDVTFQVLTKRPDRAVNLIRYFSPVSGPPPFSQRVLAAASRMAKREISELPWPLPNVWIGTSVENQHWANVRIPLLLQIPAAVRFISAEPLLESIDLRKMPMGERLELDGLTGCYTTWSEPYPKDQTDAILSGITRLPPRLPGLDWCIVGGESGAGFRDPGVQTIVDTAQQFVYAGVPVFVKQDAHLRPGQQGRIPDVVWAFKQFPEAA